MMNQVTNINSFPVRRVHTKPLKSLNYRLKMTFPQGQQEQKETFLPIGKKTTNSAIYNQKKASPHSKKVVAQKVSGKESQKNNRSSLKIQKKNSTIALNDYSVASKPKKKILIAYPQQELEISIADALAQELAGAGYDIFMGTRQSICQGNIWTQQIEAEYQQSDCLIFLLTQSSLISELATEALKRAITISKTRQEQKPLIIVIGVNIASNTPVSYKLQSYLNQIQQWQWNSPEDTHKIIETILNQLGQFPDKSTPLPPQLLNLSNNSQSKINPTSSTNRPVYSTQPQLSTEREGLNTPFYLERMPYQQQCYQKIVKPGALIRICAPRQMGKTSLLNRILSYAVKQNYHTVLLDFQHTDKQILTNLDQLVHWFCLAIAKQLNLPPNLEEYWNEDFGIKASSSIYLEDYILRTIKEPIVIAIEEISAIFEEIGVTQDFLSLLRCWHEKAKVNPLWAKLRLVLVQSTDAYIPLNINQSPLNVGLGIHLPSFSLEEVETLVRHDQLSLSPQEMNQLMKLLGGHPYLIQLSLYYLSQKKLTVSELLETPLTDSGIYNDHLYCLYWKLQQAPHLMPPFQQVLLSPSPVPLEHHLGCQLKSLGLVTVNNGQYSVSCELYQRYFSDRLIN
ncbi:toll-interleukin receptor [Gloeothece citriformis PCC 7424]|uniref:Toll-interleukin receptor n=1 Tax=Gloeothece citriformis (strain PCC 7424) TaxID=65393 RepID=B7KBC3_GLOC7|nr:AAA-like domain-containing protein [Gloeothece citriformis]ACK71479.1 toll-interleukin receptor [Gloeothece citriformis PCC 7424]